MKSAEYVDKQVEKLKKTGNQLQWVAWQIALLCVGWAYVFGALGEYCSPTNRKKYFRSKGSEHPTIASKCQVIREDNPKGTCKGCKWYPGEKKTRFFDCRGFTRWILKVVFGFTLYGAGATSQWDSKANWSAKGKIKTIPKDKLVCVFQYNSKNGKMKHTGLAYNGETVECQVGVQHKKLDSRWTHWALPKCVDPDYVAPKEQKETETEDKPVKKATLKKGSKGDAVKALQKQLIALGYDVGKKGADGDFGSATLAAVKAFQKANGLKADGVVGESTWAKLDNNPAKAPEKTYTVTISGLVQSEADALLAQWPSAKAKEE